MAFLMLRFHNTTWCRKQQAIGEMLLPVIQVFSMPMRPTEVYMRLTWCILVRQDPRLVHIGATSRAHILDTGKRAASGPACGKKFSHD